MIFYDFEVFAKDGLVVFIDTDKREKVTVVNDPDRLKEYSVFKPVQELPPD